MNRRIIAVVLAAGTGLFAAWGLLHWHALINFGDLPNWLAAVGTIAAVLLAVGQIRASRVATVAATEEVRLAREEAEDGRKQQARLIASGADRDDTIAGTVRFVVRNASPYSVRAFRLVGAWPSGSETASAKSWRADILKSDPRRVHGGTQPWPERLPNGELRAGQDAEIFVTFYRDPAGTELMDIDTRAEEFSPSIDIEFVDHRGVRWRRWAATEPRPAPIAATHREPPPPIPEAPPL